MSIKEIVCSANWSVSSGVVKGEDILKILRSFLKGKVSLGPFFGKVTADFCLKSRICFSLVGSCFDFNLSWISAAFYPSHSLLQFVIIVSY